VATKAAREQPQAIFAGELRQTSHRRVDTKHGRVCVGNSASRAVNPSNPSMSSLADPRSGANPTGGAGLAENSRGFPNVTNSPFSRWVPRVRYALA
jgi:hypothetical protein